MTDLRRTYLAVRDRRLLRADGRNRALRTFLVALGTDVGLAVAMLLATTFSEANSWGDLEWSVLGFLVVKTVITAAGAYLLRTVLDPSSVPTPLPPSPQPAPAEPAVRATGGPVVGGGPLRLEPGEEILRPPFDREL